MLTERCYIKPPLSGWPKALCDNEFFLSFITLEISLMLKKRFKSRRVHSRLERPVRPHLEKLEDRIAPGSLIDLLGLIAFGGKGSDAQVAASGIDSSPAQRPAEARRGKLEQLPELPLNKVNDLETLATDEYFRNDSSSRSDWLDRDWGILAAESKSIGMQANVLFQDFSSRFDEELHQSRGLSNRSEILSQSRTHFVLGSGELLLPGTAFQPGAGAPSASSVPVSWPNSTDTGLDYSSVTPRPDANISPGFRVDAGLFGPDGEAIALLEGIQAQEATAIKSDSPVVKQPAYEEHRLPKELRNRSDDLLKDQSLEPYSLRSAQPTKEPTTGVVRSQPEYDPMRGVLFSYTSYTSVVTDLVKELTQDPSRDEIAYVVVTSSTQQNNATNAFVAAGADMSKVEFFIQPMNSVWMRDYGPHFITVDDAMAIVDSHYYPSRSLDNFIPTLVGRNNFQVPTYDMGMYYSGGNFMVGPDNSAFVTALVNLDNPTADGFDANLISELYNRYQGIETLHVLPQLPFSVDGTGHIDMWMYLVDEQTVVISEFLAGSNSTAIQVTNNAVSYMENLGFKVFRTPAWNASGVHYTYTNAFRVNDRIFVPVYGTAFKPGGSSTYNSRDAIAMQVWQAAAGPGVQIVPIQCFQIISASGAIHCIVKQVPRYTGTAPAVNIISPAGGEILTPATQYKVQWSAIDTNNTRPESVLIYVSYGDDDYQHITTTTDTGFYWWTLSSTVSRAENATVMVVAQSASGEKTEVISQPFSITPGRVTTYDFSSGAGIDKFAYGSQTNSWANVNGNPFPVTSQLVAANYTRLAASDASGGVTDPNRYISPIPSPVSAESTHLFTFQITTPIDRIAKLDVLWEGFAAFCTQVELYVWDIEAGNWGDGQGLAGVNRYMDSWAGNIDGELTGSIRSEFSRYIDQSGVIRLLVYADRPGAVGSVNQGMRTYHDYIRVDVKELETSIPNPQLRT
jgi:agmatine deiminase